MKSVSFIENHKPYIAMIIIQFIYSGMALLSKVAISKGINPFVFVVYRQAFATIALAPFAFFLESNKINPLSFLLLFKIFMVSLCGLTLSLNLYYVAINYTTATFATASTNTIPAITFIMAVLFRMENVCLRKLHGIAKVLGSVIGVGGALVFAFVKGPSLSFMKWHTHNNLTPKSNNGGEDHPVGELIKGSFLMLAANTTWCLFLILQAVIIKEYNAKIRFITLQCFFSCIQSAVWAIAINRNPSSWKLEWDVSLFSVAYCGIIVTGVTYWLQIWTIQKKGPVFTAMYNPLALIITVIISSFIWRETLHWGSVGGAILLVGGLYGVLWGKNKEEESKSDLVKNTKENNVTQNKEEIHLEGITI